MSTPVLATKLYIPPPRPHVVIRPRLIERLNEGSRNSRLILISAPAGFGKTTLVSQWLAGCQRPAAWLSLEEGENDPARFLTYLVAALQTIAPTIGDGVVGALQSPQPPPPEAILTALLNDLTTIQDQFVLVLDDYHVIDAQAVDHALTYLVEHLPPQMHLVITTREDPAMPLARLRARGHLTEVRAADLRFTPAEAADFLNQVMGLSLSVEDIAALERRTEGWIAGLQLAAISLQGHEDATCFIRSFTGSHHFVLDYLVEEVLGQQPEHVQTFLLHTSILDRFCGSLCEAVVLDPAISGQETLEYLERANLFIVPLDNKRRWYRYHHLFADLLQQRLQQSTTSSAGDESKSIAELHIRASQWYEGHGLEIEAFQHAAAANDVERAERLIEGKWMPLHFRGAVAPVLNWLESLPKTVLDARPSLWTAFASTLLATGQNTRVEQTIQAAEAALQGAEPDDSTRDLIGRIAAIRATLAANQYQVETIIAQSRLALEYLDPNNLAFRTSTAWKLGFAYYLQGDRVAARRAITKGGERPRHLWPGMDSRTAKRHPLTQYWVYGTLVPTRSIRPGRLSLALAGSLFRSRRRDNPTTSGCGRGSDERTAQWTNEEADASEPRICMRGRVHRPVSLADLLQEPIAGWEASQPNQNPLDLSMGSISDVISIGQASGNTMYTLLATIALGVLQEAGNQLHLAAATYQHVLQLLGDMPLPLAFEPHLGLARICYEWNDLDAALQHAQQSIPLAGQLVNMDRSIATDVFLARLKLAQGDVDGAGTILAEAGRAARQQNFMNRIPEVAAAQVRTLLRQGNLPAAAQLAQAHELPISQARVHLAEGDPSAALAVLEPWRKHVEAKEWQDERLKVMVLQAIALQAHGEKDKAVQLLIDALALAEPGGFIRLFVDEGLLMAQLLSAAFAHGMMPDYVRKLLAVFKAEEQKNEYTSSPPAPQSLIEPLSQRELEVLQLMAQGLSNQEMSERLFLALDTVKGHNRKIFGKLQVQRRTEAIARARELGLL